MSKIENQQTFQEDKDKIETLLAQEQEGALGTVKGSVSLPKFTIVNGEKVKYTKEDIETFTQLILSDIYWWPIVANTKLIENDANIDIENRVTILQQWQQNGIILPFMGFSHNIYVLDRSEDQANRSVQKTVAIARSESKVNLSYIARYIVEETDDGFTFTLDANLKGISENLSKNVIQPLTDGFLNMVVKAYFQTGEAKKLVENEIPDLLSQGQVKRSDLPLGFAYGVIGRAWMQNVNNTFSQWVKNLRNIFEN
jgi:hypothetical protein